MAGRGNKRKASGGDQKSNTKKKFWVDSSRAQSIPMGSKGILVSCVTGKENQSGREAINIITAAFEELAPGKLDTAAEQLQEEDGADDTSNKDIASLIADEVKDLKDVRKQPFKIINMGISALTYVQFAIKDGPKPSEIVAHMCRRAKETGVNNTRLCSRFYPVEKTYSANKESMEEFAKTLVEEYFPADVEEGIPFSVEYEKRASDPLLERMTVIDMFAKVVKQPPHKVDLTDPKKTIMVNVIKGTCGIAVVDDFRALARYNVKALASLKDETEKAGDEEKKD